MEWSQVLAILAGNMSLFLWSVRQARTDYLHLDKKLDENRKETNALIRSIQEDVRDFHVRLCNIEERNKEKK